MFSLCGKQLQQLYSHAAAIVHEPSSTVVHTLNSRATTVLPLPPLLLLLLLLMYDGASSKKTRSQTESHAGVITSATEKMPMCVSLLCGGTFIAGDRRRKKVKPSVS